MTQKNPSAKLEARISPAENSFQGLHQAACEKGEETYLDPETGYTVFTELYHLKRGHCCKSGCRHCPYREEPQEPR